MNVLPLIKAVAFLLLNLVQIATLLRSTGRGFKAATAWS